MKKLLLFFITISLLANCKTGEDTDVVATKIDGVVTLDYNNIKDSITVKISDIVEDL